MSTAIPVPLASSVVEVRVHRLNGRWAAAEAQPLP